MLILATLFGLLAAAIHGYIFYLEVVAFGSDAFRRVFRTQPEVEPMLRPAFNNLGIYNLGLGVMTLLVCSAAGARLPHAAKAWLWAWRAAVWA